VRPDNLIRPIVDFTQSYYTDSEIKRAEGGLTMAYEVEVIKASRKKTDRKTGGLSDILRVAPYARVSTDTKEQLSNYKSQVAYYTELVNKRSDW
jgi:predicted site-specific integrase-resolvase